MDRDLNQRMSALAHSEIRAMTQACVQAKGLNMAQGVCDTPVPPVVLRSATLAIDSGKNTYSRFDGLPELRQAIAKKLMQYNGIVADPETDITVSAGATAPFIVLAWRCSIPATRSFFSSPTISITSTHCWRLRRCRCG